MRTQPELDAYARLIDALARIYEPPAKRTATFLTSFLVGLGRWWRR